MDFANGITVISGGNGAGKSSILDALRLGFEDTTNSERPPRPPEWLCTVLIEGASNAQRWSTGAAVRAPFVYKIPLHDFPHTISYIDAAEITGKIFDRFRSDEAPQDLIEGIDPTAFTPDDLHLLSFLLRRTYDAVHVYEVTAFAENDDPTPYFSVSSLGAQYSLLEMGRGELCAIYLIWRLRQLKPGTIVLLEEPEAHLALFSQRALVDVLVRLLAEQDIVIVASSHSPGFFERLPEGHVIMVSALPTPTIWSRTSIAEIVSHLGYEAPSRLGLITEDRTAAGLLRAIIAREDPALLARIDIWWAVNGESGLRKIIQELKPFGNTQRVTVVGILDGDQRLAGSSAPFLFLPGDFPPEEVLSHALDTWRGNPSSEWTPTLTGGAATLRMRLENSDGLDHHDWLSQIGAHYGGSQLFLEGIFSVLYETVTLRDNIDTLMAGIRGSLK